MDDPFQQLLNYPYAIQSGETRCNGYPCCALNHAVELMANKAFPGLMSWCLTTLPATSCNGWILPLQGLCLRKSNAAVYELRRRIQKLNCRARDSYAKIESRLLPELKLLVCSYIPDGHFADWADYDDDDDVAN